MSQAIVFYSAASLIVISIVCMILSRNPVASAVFLILSFFGLTALYVSLDAHFVAAIQILVYAGAIMVLFIFVIMLLNLKPDELGREPFHIGTLIGFVISLVPCCLICVALAQVPQENLVFPAVTENFGTVPEIAKLLYSQYMVPFEIIGILLLVGLVGAVMLGRREE